ncbi:MAG: outer membrane beta-barrel protein [Chitinophagaceae bacterium]|nr:outer membrane beta-barrel protein [Chitinophagaceae bacterium]
MKKLFFLCLLVYVMPTEAQVYYRKSEFGAGVGGANYFGDLNTNYGFQQFSYSGNVFYKYNFSPYIALKLGGSYAHLGYSDRFSNNYYQKLRNLNFESNIYEAAIQAEFSFFRYEIGDFEHRFTPYVSIGAGIFWYNPYTTLDGERHYLRPLGTEGQNYEEYKNRRYKGTAMCFPIGLGFKFWLSRGLTIHMEAVNRSTTTDYLDDVSTTYVGIDKFEDNTPSPYPAVGAQLQDRSWELTDQPIGKAGRQRGISTTRDQYMMLQIGVSFRLPTYRCPDNL